MEAAWASDEFAGAAIHDRRRRKSLARICEHRLGRPRVSFSKALGPALRQSAHRICSHPHTTVDGLLKGHFTQTAARCRALHARDPEHPLLLVADTTVLNYASHPATEGLGPISQTERARGLLGHAVLAVPFRGEPAGLAHLALWARDPERHGRTRRPQDRAATPTAQKEGQKWLDGLWGAEATLPPEVPGVLVADREADFHDLFAAERRPGLDLLVRAHQPRAITVGDDPAITDLRAAAEAAPRHGTVEVEVPRKPGQPARKAVLELRSAPVTLLPPRSRAAGAEPVRLWMVVAQEAHPPPDVTPLHWVLLTTLPAPDAETARRVVAYYQRRWAIEELHLVLKSGLVAERLQCDDAHTLKNSLALLYVTAWKVLHLRDAARVLPDAPAEAVLDPEALVILGASEGRPLRTAREAVRALAHFGGFPHNPSAGEPGVRSLWDGIQRLEGARAGWRLAHGQPPRYEPR